MIANSQMDLRELKEKAEISRHNFIIRFLIEFLECKVSSQKNVCNDLQFLNLHWDSKY
jgi:hypothetical protein